MRQARHGGDIYAYQEQFGHVPLDFSANINPLGMPPAAKRAAMQAAAGAVRYPDPQSTALRARLAQREKVQKEWLIFGSGAAELIFRLCFALRPSRVLLCAPAFAEYRRAAEAAGAEVTAHMLRPEDGFQVSNALCEDIAHAAPALILLGHPNNPTGQALSADRLEALCASAERVGARLLLDECFLDFLPDGEERSGKRLLETHPCVAVLKAFTKYYAMPGLRLGYLITADTALRERLTAAAQPWPISSPAEAAALAALDDADYPVRTAQLIADERAYLRRELAALGMQPIGGEANFLLFQSGRTDLAECAAQRGILIRDCSDFEGLGAGYYRVAVRTHAENQRLTAALRACCAEEEHLWQKA